MKTSDFPRISETEWEVMRAVWASYPATASEIIDRLLSADASWHPKTARTLLARLVKKQALGYEPDGRKYVYEPLVTEKQCIASASASFLDRVFGGALQPLLAHFVESRRLSPSEVEGLKQILDSTAASTPANRGKKGPRP